MSRRHASPPVLEVRGQTLALALSELAKAIEEKGWQSITVETEIVTECESVAPYRQTGVHIRVWDPLLEDAIVQNRDIEKRRTPSGTMLPVYDPTKPR